MKQAIEVDVRKVALVAVNLVVAVGAPLSNYFLFFGKSDTALQAGAAVIEVTTFTCVWLIQRSRVYKNPTTDSMRDAIAASFVVTYLVLVGWSAFFNYAVSVEESREAALAPLTQTLISNFTILTGLVVGFYFGTEAIKQVVQARETKTNSEPGATDKDQASGPSREDSVPPTTNRLS